MAPVLYNKIMQFIADFHIHSKYSRATSKDMDLETLNKWAGIKGIGILGSGDFTHPLWFNGLKEKLESAEPGLFRLKNKKEGDLRFVLTAEISCIYAKCGRTRKIHIIVFAPSFEVCEKINACLGRIGNLKSDGRPILGIDAKELTKIVIEASEDCLIVPAHIYTPWFSLFGSKSGFDSIEECFEEYAEYIFACETGLSSNPLMSWRNSALDKISLISNSDSHSPARIGREANVFESDKLSYKEIADAFNKRNGKSSGDCRLIYTIEFFPEEGRYYYDGHRNCELGIPPGESRKYNNLCPKCLKPLTIGVLSRADDLSDREEGVMPDKGVPFKSLIPLNEIIADALGMTVASKRVKMEYERLIKELGSEFKILLNAPRRDIESLSLPEVAEGIIRVREGKVFIEPGYDGVYGKINIFSGREKKDPTRQSLLF